MVGTLSIPDIPAAEENIKQEKKNLPAASNHGAETFHVALSPSEDDTSSYNLSRSGDLLCHDDNQNYLTLVNDIDDDNRDNDVDDADNDADNCVKVTNHDYNKHDDDSNEGVSFISCVKSTEVDVNEADCKIGDVKVYGKKSSLIRTLYWDEHQDKDVAYCEKVRTGEENKKCGYRLKDVALMVADNILAVFFVCPLNVLFWQGLWDLLARNVFPDSEVLSGITTWLIGLGGIFILSVLQKILTNYVKPSKKLHCTPGYQIYTYLLGFSNVSHWHGLWLLIDHYTGVGAISSWTTFIIGQTGLCVMRCFATAQAPPTFVSVDIDPDFFQHTTRFRTKPGLTWSYVADVFFTVFVVHNMVVIYWRGTWALMDLYIYPEDGDFSAIITLILSYLFHFLAFILQFPLNYFYKRCNSSTYSSTICRIILEQFHSTISNAVNVASWRGVWNLSEKYLVIESHEDLCLVITHSLGIGVLMLLLCGQSVGMKGCDLDGTSADDEGCILPNSYLRYFLITRASQLEKRDSEVKNSTDTESI